MSNTTLPLRNGTQWLDPRLLSLEDIAVAPASELRQDSMYDDSGFLRETPDGFQEAVRLPKLAWSNRRRDPRQHLTPYPTGGKPERVAGLVYPIIDGEAAA